MQTNHYSITCTQAADLVEAARAGEIAGLLDYCLQCLRRRALLYVQSFRSVSDAQFEIEDLLQEAALQMCQRMDAALASDHPVPLLMRNGWGAMLHYCIHYQTAIYTPLRGGRAQRPWYTRSLDAPLPDCELTLADVLAAEDLHV